MSTFAKRKKARRPRKAAIRAARALVQQPHRRAVTPRPQS